MNQKSYSDYDLTDFLTDEAFRDNPDDYVRKVLAIYPQKAAMLEEAIAIAGTLKRFKLNNDRQARRASWEGIEQRISVVPVKSYKWRWTVAASIFVLLIAGSIYWYQQPNVIVKHTRYAETSVLHLPDESEVTLGANSTISYKQREVWLKGDASFHVKHLKNVERFIVHTADSVTIEVLGTVFMVRQRHNKTYVALESGAVKISMADKTPQILHPGETIEIIHGEIAQRTSQGAAQHATAFRQQHLMMQQMPVREILQALEDNYGKKLMVKDTNLLHRQVDGTLPLYNEQQALQALATILDIHIHNRNDTLWLDPAQ